MTERRVHTKAAKKTFGKVSPANLRVLQAFHSFETQWGFPPTLGNLAKEAARSKSTVTVNVAYLELRGYLERTDVTRYHPWRITPLGYTALRRSARKAKQAPKS